MKIGIIVALGATAALTGCAPAAHYHPQPILPAKTASRLESRTLRDPGLREFMEKNLGHALSPWPIATWDLENLVLAAYYFNPQMDVARARAQAAKGAIITAGERPNPTLALTPGLPSPYLFNLSLDFLKQRVGKRAIKIEQARALSRAARMGIALTAWQVRSAVRAADLDYSVSLKRAELTKRAVALRSQQVRWLSARLAAGEIARPEVASAQSQLLTARLALSAAEGRVPEARASLAAAIGVPVAALAGVNLSLSAFDHPPDFGSISAKTIQREALLNRLDVRQGLAEYEAAEAALQLEIARQYPNLHLGPGYQFEEGDNFFTLALSTVLPVFNRNQGPIAEAVARRKEAGANFLEIQARAVAASEEAFARYRAALDALGEARKAAGQIEKVREPMAVREVSLGESDKLFLSSVQLEGTAAAEAKLTALYNAQQALGQLEDAVERPIGAEH